MPNKTNRDGHLPYTRKGQIPYLLRNEIGLLFASNLMMFLFLIPLILCFYFGILSYHNALRDSAITSETLFSIFLMYGLISIPCFVVMGIGYAGLYNLIRRLTFDSTAKFKDFFKGIKINFKSFFLYYLLLGILSGALVINVGFYLYNAGMAPGFKITILVVNILLLLTVIIARGFYSFEASSYNNHFLVILRNSIYLFYKCFPISLINLLLSVLPALLFFFLPINVVFIPMGILATFYCSLSSLITFIIGISSFEKIFPKEQISEIYHQGLEDTNF